MLGPFYGCTVVPESLRPGGILCWIPFRRILDWRILGTLGTRIMRIDEGRPLFLERITAPFRSRRSLGFLSCD